MSGIRASRASSRWRSKTRPNRSSIRVPSSFLSGVSLGFSVRASKERPRRKRPSRRSDSPIPYDDGDGSSRYRYYDLPPSRAVSLEAHSAEGRLTHCQPSTSLLDQSTTGLDCSGRDVVRLDTSCNLVSIEKRLGVDQFGKVRPRECGLTRAVRPREDNEVRLGHSALISGSRSTATRRPSG